jgi:hypothetical protein
MARKIVNRKALREEAEAATTAEQAAGSTDKTTKKKTTKRKSRSKEAVVVRTKLLWKVFNQAAKPVATFEYHQEDAARKKAAALTQAGKQLHFVQKVKEVIEQK